jgi:transposase
MSFQGKAFTPEMKQLIINLKHHFDTEKRAGRYVSTMNAVQRVAQGLDIGEATVKRIMAEQHHPVKQTESPRHGKPPYRLSSNMQPIIRTFIREKNLLGQKIRAEDIQTYLDATYSLEIPMTTLLRSLSRFGFTYGTGKRRTHVKEQARVILARRRYLRRKRGNRNADGTLKQPEVYLDETFINTHHSCRFTWYLEQDGPWVNKPAGKGPRRIIVDAMTCHGWVPGARLIFDSKTRTGDYHGQMNWENFSRWFEQQLLPNIPDNSLIILDNAPYHNTLADESFPTPRTLKHELCEWLDRNAIPRTEDMLKPELFELCRRLAPAPEFQLEQLLKQTGHSALHTPPYHPELQPIETCWAVVKNYMADHCDFTMNTFHTELPNAFKKVTALTCQKIIASVVQQEEKYWHEDNQLYSNDDSKNDKEIDATIEP